MEVSSIFSFTCGARERRKDLVTSFWSTIVSQNSRPRLARFACWQNMAPSFKSSREQSNLLASRNKIKNPFRGFDFVRGRGLEPPRLAAYAPQAYVYTISPPARPAIMPKIEECSSKRKPDIVLMAGERENV